MSTTPPNPPGDEDTGGHSGGESAPAEPNDDAARRSRRTFAPTLLIGVPAAAIAAVAANKSLLVSPMLTGDRYADAGTIPLAGSLGLVPLVAWAALVLLRGKSRVVAAIIGLATSVGALAAADAGLDGTHDAMARTFRELGQEGSFSSGLSGWFWAMGVACLVSALAFFVATRHAPAWPALSRKYDAPTRSRPATEPTSNQELWKAIDDGRDPTATTAPDDN